MLLQKGSRGEEVRKLQQKLISLGYSVGQYGADGVFGQGTYDAVIKFQRANGLSADGIVGQATWNALNNSSGNNSSGGELLKMGSRGDKVRELQQKLINKGYSVGQYGADGVFGQGTYDAVIKFQRTNGLSADGIVGPATWKVLNSSSNSNDDVVVGGSGVSKFIEVAKQELKKGFKETNGNNINPYGEWYGMNGQPWCAMFVSWCANKAGILGSIVPRYALCSDGVNWYKARGRYKTRISGYNPKPGDVIFFKNSSGSYYHTGIVVEYLPSEGAIRTIEGNSSDAVKMNYYKLNKTIIDGYGVN